MESTVEDGLMDIELHYEEAGSGDPMILLHGNGEDHRYFNNQIDHFSKRFRVIALDTRGHGDSPRGDEPLSIAQFADDLYGFMKSLKLSHATILGFSDGANIAMSFALEHPEMADALILNGGNLNFKGLKTKVRISLTISHWLATFGSNKSQSAAENKELLELMIFEPNLTPEMLNGLTMPTLVIAGTDDMIADDHTRLIYESLPNATLEILEGDHFIAAARPAAFNKAVDRFLEGISA
ncbi:MAG: alpha/beta fold hydrolase [Coriobacteriales bacterium]|jgi:pimeloyl-ACP methyl ester carboxylesterase